MLLDTDLSVVSRLERRDCFRLGFYFSLGAIFAAIVFWTVTLSLFLGLMGYSVHELLRSVPK